MAAIATHKSEINFKRVDAVRIEQKTEYVRLYSLLQQLEAKSIFLVKNIAAEHLRLNRASYDQSYIAAMKDRPDIAKKINQ